jgi:hypothetical protein
MPEHGQLYIFCNSAEAVTKGFENQSNQGRMG